MKAVVRGQSRGFSLLEILISLAITMVVMALVFQTTRQFATIYRAQSELARETARTSMAVEDMVTEIAQAGQGMGVNLPILLAGLPDDKVRGGALTVRSNPEGIAARLSSEIGENGVVSIAPSGVFEKGDRVLVVDLSGASERAKVVRAETAQVELKSLDGPGGSFRNEFPSDRMPRLLKLHEVRYYLESVPEEGTQVLVKEVEGWSRRVLARGVTGLAFEVLDGEGQRLAPSRVEANEDVALVRIHLRYLLNGLASAENHLATAVSLSTSSGSVDFQKPAGFRLSRYFYPIDSPVGVAARIGADWGVILSSGPNSPSDPGNLYSFLLQQDLFGTATDNVIWLEDVRRPVMMIFAPEGSAMAGSLFLNAYGLRQGQLTRVLPDAGGRLSQDSEIVTFDGTASIARAGGLAFGADDALYVTSHENGALFRLEFDGGGVSAKKGYFDQEARK